MTDTETTAGDSLEASDELSVTEVAELLGLHTATIRAWVYEERLPARKDGRKWLIRRKDVDQLLSDQPRLGRPHRARRTERRDSALVSEAQLTDPRGSLHSGTDLLEGGLL